MTCIIGKKIISLLQTQSEAVGAFVEEFGEAHWITLVALLDDGSAIQINEYDHHQYTGNVSELIDAELAQDQYNLNSIVNKKIVRLIDNDEEFAIVLENDLCFNCSGGPGGNYPSIWHLLDMED